MTYQWRTDPPDSTGIWAYSDDKITWFEQAIRTIPAQLPNWKYYCKLMDLPTIEAPIKYRDVTEADVGLMVEVRDEGRTCWHKSTLLAIVPVRGRIYFVSQSGLWDHARIRTDTPPLRECWVDWREFGAMVENKVPTATGIRMREVRE